jgi:hypothetical protein
MPVKKGLVLGAALTAVVCSAHAADQQFADWSAGLNDPKTVSYAATVNDSGSLLGEYCYFSIGKCIWTLAMEPACTGSAIYPVLGNTASGAVHLQLQCDGKTDNGNYRYMIVDWKELESLLKDSNLVSFAFPMQGGVFKVLRFSLTGRTDAMGLAETIAANQSAPTQNRSATKRNTSDTTL